LLLRSKEIHYDRIGGRDAASLVNADRPDVIEIWNNVFIQYNREQDGSLRPLPAQHVDTGMGFERLTSILQGVDSNYDTDIFQPIFAAIQQITGARPYSGKVGADDSDYVDMAYRVVADHIRTLCFAIADGAVPSNDGRGYVLRRVLRRAVRYGRQNLGAELGFFAKLVPTLVNLMGNTFPELREKQDHVTVIIMDEEESFSRTLDKGLTKFNELSEKVGSDKVFSGEDAHFLYTSMGFPVDLTELMAEEKGMTLDKVGFHAKMDEEAAMSKAAHDAKMSGDSGKDMRLVAEQTSYLVGQNVSATDDSAKYIWDANLEGCTIKALFIGRNETEDNIGFVPSISPESGAVGVILDQSSFYAEAGGQTYDTGTISTQSGAIIRLKNVQMYGPYVLHIGVVESGICTVGDIATCSVDYVRRLPIASNHTMTHVLNYALKDVLLTQVEKETGQKSSQSIDQKGSLVDETKFRFDFSWNGPLTVEQLSMIEKLCMERIEMEVPVEAYVAPLEGAQQISSLRAVFGEKYPDPVRVVAVTDRPITDMLSNPQDSQWNEYSVEFCGGTHLSNTKQAEAFVLLSEEGIAKGIRRVVGVTLTSAKEAIQLANEFENKLHVASTKYGDELELEVKTLGTELNALQISAVKKAYFRDMISNFAKQVVAYKKEKVSEMATEVVAKAIAEASTTESNKVVIRFDFGTDGKVAKSIITSYGKNVKDKALMLISADIEEDKCLVVAYAPKGMDSIDCKAWVTATIAGTDGKGGGKQDSANFQVPGAANADSLVQKAKEYQ
jgi:alanyl-tRNA synthetase